MQLTGGLEEKGRRGGVGAGVSRFSVGVNWEVREMGYVWNAFIST